MSRMSKCNMNKFKAGGRCGGDSSSGTSAKGDTQGVATSFSALMAARDAQDRAFTAPTVIASARPAVIPTEQAIVIVKKPIADKQKIMDLILQGDMNDD